MILDHKADPTEEVGIQYRPFQIDLPLRPHRCPTSELWPGIVEWPKPGDVLADFLESVGVAKSRQVARTLLIEFGSLSELLAASRWRLMRKVGPRLAATIRRSNELMRAVLAERVLKGPVLAGTDAVIEFLRLELGGLRHERFLALYLDARLHLLRIERIDGVKDGAAGDIPRIIHCAMDVGASGIVLVHNHPSGEAMPSEADKRLTRSVAQIADTLNMVLVDHLIVTQSAVTSMRKHNFL